MAKIRIEDRDVIVHLSLLEKVAAMRGDVRIPLSTIDSVRVVKNPFAEVEGIRFPDTGVPGIIALGTWQRRDGREFVCVYRGQPGVVVELDSMAAPYKRVILSGRDPNVVADCLLRKLDVGPLRRRKSRSAAGWAN
jgi:hypothetical protein